MSSDLETEIVRVWDLLQPTKRTLNEKALNALTVIFQSIADNDCFYVERNQQYFGKWLGNKLTNTAIKGLLKYDKKSSLFRDIFTDKSEKEHLFLSCIFTKMLKMIDCYKSEPVITGEIYTTFINKYEDTRLNIILNSIYP